MPERLSSWLADILREVMNIGGAHAATALATLRKERVTIDVPKVELRRIEDVPAALGHAGDVRAMTLHRIQGDVTGIVMFSFDEQDGSAISGQQKDGLDALAETGNILAGACLKAIGNFLDLRMQHTEPRAITDYAGAVLNAVLADIGQHADDTLFTRISFRMETSRIPGQMVILFDPDSSQNILHAAQLKTSHP